MSGGSSTSRQHLQHRPVRSGSTFALALWPLSAWHGCNRIALASKLLTRPRTTSALSRQLIAEYYLRVSDLRRDLDWQRGVGSCN